MTETERNLMLFHKMQINGKLANPHVQYYAGDNTSIIMHSKDLCMFSHSLIDEDLSNMYLKDLYVIPTARGNNIGSNIIEMLKRICIKGGLKAIETESENDSLIFFKKLGFKQMKNEEKNRLILEL